MWFFFFTAPIVLSLDAHTASKEIENCLKFQCLYFYDYYTFSHKLNLDLSSVLSKMRQLLTAGRLLNTK